MKEKIKQYALDLGINIIGFTNYRIYEELREKYKQKFEKQWDVFLSHDVNTILDAKKLLSSVDTIIAIAIPYPKTCNAFETLKKDEVYFSSSSWGEDYHIVLKKLMVQLVEKIKQDIIDFEYYICVDTSLIDDRYIAYQAGLGFFGKNSLLINEQYGSYIYLGSILTNLHLEPDQPVDKTCFHCNLCQKKCPVKAITDEGINSRICLSYVTQKKGILTEEERQYMNQCIYGCDICSRVCPHNKKIQESSFFTPSGIEFFSIYDPFPETNRSFKEKFGHLSGSWRGRSVIARNIKLYKEKIEKE